MTHRTPAARVRCELLKYRITFFLSLAGLALAGWIVNIAYWQHVEILNKGEAVGAQMQRLALDEKAEVVHAR
jgi:hypothetical protein